MALVNQDRAVVAKRNATNNKLRADAGYHARHARACAEAKRRTMADPAVVEKMREAGRTVGAKNLHRANTPEARAIAAKAIQAKRMAWCPEDLWGFAEQLKRKGYLLAERKEIIAAEVADREAKRLASLSPLERQMERLAAGARLVAKPDFRKADPAYTMGGVATGLL